MKFSKTIISIVILAFISGCSDHQPQQVVQPQVVQPAPVVVQQGSDGTSALLGAAAGFAVGRMSAHTQQTPQVVSNTTIINKTVVVNKQQKTPETPKVVETPKTPEVTKTVPKTVTTFQAPRVQPSPQPVSKPSPIVISRPAPAPTSVMTQNNRK